MDKQIWFISDNHFFHQNIIKYTDRPFLTYNEMNEYMIDKWNGVVGKDDIVVHGGDFALGGVSKMKQLLERLNGYKILVRGNHDRSNKQMKEAGFNEVLSYWSNGDILVRHNPRTTPRELIEKHKIFLYGHIHNNIIYGKNVMNISVEHLDYTPISLDEVMSKYKEFY